MRKSIAQQLRDRQRLRQIAQSVTPEQLLSIMLGGEPNPTQGAVIHSEENAIAYMGAAGVSKTSTLMASALMRAMFIPNSRWCIARHDYNKLLLTTMVRGEEMLGRLPDGVLVDRKKDAPERWYIRCIDGISISEIWWLGLKEYPGSFEFHGAFVEEASEVDEANLLGLRTRLRAPGVPEHKFITQIFFNPPMKTHWLYQACTGKDARGRKVSKPVFTLYIPKKDENRHNLPDDYNKQFEGVPEEMRQRLVDNEWGTAFEGMPVYPKYNSKVHAVDVLPFLEDNVLFRFWDFGYRHPWCGFFQLDEEYRLRGLKELYGNDETIKTFGYKVLAETATHYHHNAGVMDIGDPAARQRKDTGSTLEHLDEMGIELMYETGENIDDGLLTVRTLLERMPGGIPAIQINRLTMPMLHEALRGGYHRDERGERPIKDGVYDHPADGFRYGVRFLYTDTGEPKAMPDMSVRKLLDAFKGESNVSAEYSRDVDPYNRIRDDNTYHEGNNGWHLTPGGIWERS